MKVIHNDLPHWDRPGSVSYSDLKDPNLGEEMDDEYSCSELPSVTDEANVLTRGRDSISVVPTWSKMNYLILNSQNQNCDIIQ